MSARKLRQAEQRLDATGEALHDSFFRYMSRPSAANLLDLLASARRYANAIRAAVKVGAVPDPDAAPPAERKPSRAERKPRDARRRRRRRRAAPEQPVEHDDARLGAEIETEAEITFEQPAEE